MCPLDPQRPAIAQQRDALGDGTAAKSVPRCRASQADDVPAHIAGAGLERDAGLEFGLRIIEDDGLLWQVFADAVGGHGDAAGLATREAAAAVEFRGRRRGQHGAGAAADAEIHRQAVAARNAARRMQDIDMARAVGLGMKGPLDHQWPLVPALRQPRAAADRVEAQIQFRLPGILRVCRKIGQACMKFAHGSHGNQDKFPAAVIS